MFDYNSSQEIKRTVKIRPSCGSVYIKKFNGIKQLILIVILSTCRNFYETCSKKLI